jgi:hypothetical protein
MMHGSINIRFIKMYLNPCMKSPEGSRRLRFSDFMTIGT